MMYPALLQYSKSNYKQIAFLTKIVINTKVSSEMVFVGGFGNPLLDVTVKISDTTLLNKYNLNEDDQKVFTNEEDLKLLLNDISNLPSIVSPGGCAQNTLRILQWLLEEPNSTVMFGSVGQDEQGCTLKNLVNASGVQTTYIERNKEQTGTAIALIHKENRSLVAYLGAAQNYKIEDLQTDNRMDILKQIGLIYMEAFFITNRIEVANFVQEFCLKNNTIFVFNLSAAFMSKNHPKEMLNFVQKSDILIGNYKEYEAFLSLTSKQDVITLAQDLCAKYNNSKNLKHEKIVIITNGSKSVMCIHGKKGKIEEFLVPKLETDKIGDTTGAGDAFAAGFLGGLLKGLDPIVCLKWGCWVSRQIIQQIGCTIPSYTATEVKNII